MRYLTRVMVIVLALGLWAGLGAEAGNKKMMTISAAKVVAERAIIESVIGLKVRSKESVQDMIAQNVTIEAKTAAAIKGIEILEVIYDPAKDIAKATAEIRVGKVENIIGRRIDYGNAVVRRVGFATSTPEMAAPLKALRAAEIDAYKELAKKIVGFKLQSGTTVENYLLQSDDIRTKMMAAIYGAEMKGYRWDEQGDAHVQLELKTHRVVDILRQRLDYQGEVITVEGQGALTDDFSQAQQKDSGGFAPTASKIREGTLDIPTGTPAEPARDGGGANDLLRNNPNP
ncbi:conserved hypothetical protein [Gammaproteobacteria bacterium]